MRLTLVFTVASFFLLSAVASHTPPPGCDGHGQPSVGVVQLGAGADVYYLVDDVDGDAVGPHAYEESNGIAGGDDAAHGLQREHSHAAHAHPDLPAGCADPLVVPDAHVF